HGRARRQGARPRGAHQATYLCDVAKGAVPDRRRNVGRPMEETRRRTLYGRRRGKKLRAGQRSLLDTLLPRLVLTLPEASRKIDLAQAFGGVVPPQGIWLEVGFGAGEHLVCQAPQPPQVRPIRFPPYPH